MTKEQAIENLENIIKLAKDEITQNDKNITAIFDLTDLKSLKTVLSMLKEKDNIIASKDRLLSVLTIEQNENEKELEMLKDFKEIAESKVGELSPIRIKKNKSVIKQTMSQIERRSRAER